MREAVPRRVEAYVTRDGKDVFQKWLDELVDQRARMLITKQLPKSGWATWDNTNRLGKAYRKSS